MLTLDELNDKVGAVYPITEQQFNFAKQFVAHGNGMRAVREAGYQHSTPGSQSSAAYRLLRLEKIQKAIEIIKAHEG